MARMARVIVPRYPHHITQRGNRRLKTFLEPDDYPAYIELMAPWCQQRGVAIWAYCLMPNHVHLIAVPSDEDGLRLAIGEAHRRYTRRVNFRENWRGHLWQGRFASFVLDHYYLLAAARYIERNPVRAGLVKRPEQWPWSSAAAHLAGQDDALVKVAPLLKSVPDWRKFLAEADADDLAKQLHTHGNTGRPLGKKAFIARLETKVGRPLAPRKPGRKPKMEGN
jgi:putative transposase